MTFDRRQAILAEVKKQFPEYGCFFGFDYLGQIKKRFESGQSFIFVDHAYFGRGYKDGKADGNFRVILSDIHQRKLIPRDKPKTFAYEPREWRKGKHILVFPPSKTIWRTFDCPNWTPHLVVALRKFTDRPIYIKPKDSHLSLAHMLEDCHAVIGYGTVAAVESAMAGVPVFAGPRCPATPIAVSDIEQIENPIYPDREPWFKNLTHSQFSLDEIRSGLCRETLLGN